MKSLFRSVLLGVIVALLASLVVMSARPPQAAAQTEDTGCEISQLEYETEVDEEAWIFWDPQWGFRYVESELLLPASGAEATVPGSHWARVCPGYYIFGSQFSGGPTVEEWREHPQTNNGGGNTNCDPATDTACDPDGDGWPNYYDVNGDGPAPTDCQEALLVWADPNWGYDALNQHGLVDWFLGQCVGENGVDVTTLPGLCEAQPLMCPPDAQAVLQELTDASGALTELWDRCANTLFPEATFPDEALLSGSDAQVAAFWIEAADWIKQVVSGGPGVPAYYTFRSAKIDVLRNALQGRVDYPFEAPTTESNAALLWMSEIAASGSVSTTWDSIKDFHAVSITDGSYNSAEPAHVMVRMRQVCNTMSAVDAVFEAGRFHTEEESLFGVAFGACRVAGASNAAMDEASLLLLANWLGSLSEDLQPRFRAKDWQAAIRALETVHDEVITQLANYDGSVTSALTVLNAFEEAVDPNQITSEPLWWVTQDFEANVNSAVSIEQLWYLNEAIGYLETANAAGATNTYDTISQWPAPENVHVIHSLCLALVTDVETACVNEPILNRTAANASELLIAQPNEQAAALAADGSETLLVDWLLEVEDFEEVFASNSRSDLMCGMAQALDLAHVTMQERLATDHCFGPLAIGLDGQVNEFTSASGIIDAASELGAGVHQAAAQLASPELETTALSAGLYLERAAQNDTPVAGIAVDEALDTAHSWQVASSMLNAGVADGGLAVSATDLDETLVLVGLTNEMCRIAQTVQEMVDAAPSVISEGQAQVDALDALTPSRPTPDFESLACFSLSGFRTAGGTIDGLAGSTDTAATLGLAATPRGTRTTGGEKTAVSLGASADPAGADPAGADPAGGDPTSDDVEWCVRQVDVVGPDWLLIDTFAGNPPNTAGRDVVVQITDVEKFDIVQQSFDANCICEATIASLDLNDWFRTISFDSELHTIGDAEVRAWLVATWEETIEDFHGSDTLKLGDRPGDHFVLSSGTHGAMWVYPPTAVLSTGEWVQAGIELDIADWSMDSVPRSAPPKIVHVGTDGRWHSRVELMRGTLLHEATHLSQHESRTRIIDEASGWWWNHSLWGFHNDDVPPSSNPDSFYNVDSAKTQMTEGAAFQSSFLNGFPTYASRFDVSASTVSLWESWCQQLWCHQPGPYPMLHGVKVASRQLDYRWEAKHIFTWQDRSLTAAEVERAYYGPYFG